MSTASRRSFLGAGLALPAIGSLRTGSPSLQRPTAGSPAVKLEYANLGKTGLKVTRVAFGCMTTSDPSVIERAADLGVNFFDTARVYQGGNNERMVGAVLKKRRRDIVLSSKTLSYAKEAALSDLDTSLRELQTDYLDIWYLHDRNAPGQVSEGLLEAQRIAKRQGKIRFAGISLHAAHAEIIPLAIRLNHFDVMLVSYNYTMDPSIEGLLASAKEAGLGIVAMKALAGGVRPTVPAYKAPLNMLNRLKRPGAALAAVKWALKNRNVDAVLPGIVDMEQLDEDLSAMASPFTDADARVLAARLEEIRPYYCRMCGRCRGACPKGLPVEDTLRFLMYAEGYGQFALGREHYQGLPAEARQARCSDCGKCAVRCPNGVDVARRMMRAQEVLG